MSTINIGIPEKDTKEVALELAMLLADENVLYLKTKNAHWNMEGPDFKEKHSFFESQFINLNEIIDELAERIRMLGHFAPASFQTYLGITHLSEKTAEKNDSEGHIKTLLLDHESIIIILRENILKFTSLYHDAGSTDFITKLMQSHEKMAWLLRAHQWAVKANA